MKLSEWLSSIGYVGDDLVTPMDRKIAEWWGWFTASVDWYASTTTGADKRKYRTERLSIHPAKMVCEDWASLAMNEGTQVSVDNTSMNEFMGKWVASTGFLSDAPKTIERMFALGTAGWALRLDNLNANGLPSRDLKVYPQSYDAQNIFPITIEDGICTECIFRAARFAGGKNLIQLSAYKLAEQGYDHHIAFFDSEGTRIFVEGVADTVRTTSFKPPFALISPALDNTYWSDAPFGVSVFDRAIGAVKLVDEAANSLWADLYLGKKRLIIPQSMVDYDDEGLPLPFGEDQQLFVQGPESDSLTQTNYGIYEYNPDLRVSDNRIALQTSLELLSFRTGLGRKYYSLDESGGIKTATEVASDNSILMRNLIKHEQVLSNGISQLCEAMLALAHEFGGLTTYEDLPVTVTFDDSIIEDTAAVKRNDREEVAAGLMPRWEYMMKWHGLPEDEARAREAELTESEHMDAEL